MNDSLLNISSQDFSRDSLLIDSSYNNDFQILEEIGYEKNMIKKVYAFLKPQSIEQAINYMTEEDGIYFHNFFKDYKHNKKTCYICGKLPQYHSDYLPSEYIEENQDEINLNENENNDLNIEVPLKNDDGFICPICGDSFDINSPEIIKYDKCGDLYCSHCWFSYLQSKIDEGYGNIKCMNYNCKENLSDDFIKNIIKDNKQLVEKFKKFSIKMEVLNNPNMKFCPVQNCDSYAEKIGKNKYVKCKKGHKFCFNCLKQWHGNEKCEEKEEEDFKIWKKGKIIKQCPNCKMWTEKNEGCNHMTCAECKYQWCWLCNGKYSSNHYYQGKCNGLQFYKPKSEEDIKKVLEIENSKRNYYFLNNEWNNPNGRIPIRYRNLNNNIDPNNPLRSFNESSSCIKLIYGILYFFLTFELYGLTFLIYIDDLGIINDSFAVFFYLIFLTIFLISFFFFLVPHIYISILIMIPGIFYWKWFEKVWIIWFVGVIINGDMII